MRRFLGCVSSLTFAAGKIYFSETFGESWEKRWNVSKWKESEGTQGSWALSAGKWFRDEHEDQGLQTAGDSKFFGISSEFDSFSNEGKELIIQYQVKYENDIHCGGAYIKVGPKMPDASKFGDSTPYSIMFGPDGCGKQMKTVLFFNYKGKNVGKKRNDLFFKQTPLGVSHLFRVTVKPDNKVRVEIDEQTIFEGDIRDDWDVLKPPMIPDPNEKRPKDWAVEGTIDDPQDLKPAAWVEKEHMLDMEATRPSDWIDQEDGEWTPPMKPNPAFTGEWKPRRVPNPAFKGNWVPRRIDNPDFEEDELVYRYNDIGFVGFDLWQVRGGTIFDNIIICDDRVEADKFAQKWRAVRDFEREARKKQKAEKKRLKSESAKSIKVEDKNEDTGEFDDDELKNRSEEM